ncbi:MAG TPA: DUF4232 domain-containing protein [Solirubrobacteraceae bacterium]|nr:DUF4232 domain-containing protein [Solirubrobacteraceae bacterium]
MRARLICPALAIVAALAVGACGGSQSATSAGSESATTPSPAGPSTTTTAASSQVSTVATTTATTTSASTEAQSASANAAGSPCRASGLALSYLGGQGATGHGLLGFALRNTRSTSCNTIGYPGIQFLGKSGEPLPTHAIHTTEDFFGHTKLRKVVVGAGKETSFRLGVTHGATSTKHCTLAYGLQVIAPNDTATLRVSIPDGVLECGSATVSPMQPGTSAYP